MNNTASFDAENAISAQSSAKIYADGAILAYDLSPSRFLPLCIYLSENAQGIRQEHIFTS